MLGEADIVSGWLQVVLQGGALGLLGVMVLWLFPAFLRESRAEREQLTGRTDAMIRSLQTDFAMRNGLLVQAIEHAAIEHREALERLSTLIDAALKRMQ